MQINKTNNTPNFTGAFILKPNNAQTKEIIPNIIKKGRQIFYNIKEEGDVVLVTKDKYDKSVRDFIEAENIKFRYYPEISTKSGLDDEVPSRLKTLLNIKNNCIVRTLSILDKFIPNNPLHLSKQSEYIHEAMNTLRLNISSAKIEIDDKGLFIIKDKAKQRTIKSTGFKNGMSYICIIPDSPTQASRRILVGKNGKEIIKEYNTPKEIKDFLKTFKKLMES